MKNRARKKTYQKRSAGWHAGIWPCWNGLITSGKERPARLIKTLKLMDYVYVCADEYSIRGTAYFVGDGFMLRNYCSQDIGENINDIIFVKNEIVDCFDFHKYVGCKNVFHDEIDDKHREMALQYIGSRSGI